MSMSFEDWVKNGWLRPHRPVAQEIAGLRAVIERDLAASGDEKLDGDWRFAIAYNAALQSAALALRAAGYEVPKGGGAHHHTIESLKLTLDDDGSIVTPLQQFRAKRGGGIYETTGIASDTEIEELRNLARELRDRVVERVRTRHPQLMSKLSPKGQQPTASPKNRNSRKNPPRSDHREP